MLRYSASNYFFHLKKDFLIWPLLLLIPIFFLQGCATVYRDLSSAEASAYVEKIAGTTKPLNTKLYIAYFMSEEWRLFDGRNWLCDDNKRNIGPATVRVERLTLKFGHDNFVNADTSSVEGCSSSVVEREHNVGRYDDKYLYIYKPTGNTTVQKFLINKYLLEWVSTLKFADNELMWIAAPPSYASTCGEYTCSSEFKRMDYNAAYAGSMQGHMPTNQDLMQYRAESLGLATEDAYRTSGSRARVVSEINQARREAEQSIGASIVQVGADNSQKLADIDRQKNAAINESNRVRNEQAAARERARAEREENRRDAERNKHAGDELIEKQKQALKEEQVRKLGQQSQQIEGGKQEQERSKAKETRLAAQKMPEEARCVLQGTGICRGGAVTETRGGMFYVKQPNNCGYQLYVSVCIKTKSGHDDCGSESIRPGGNASFWHASDDATGQFSVTSVGVLKGGDDWSCMGEKRRLGSEG